MDDANEGRAGGECVEHLWGIEKLVLAGDGAYLEHECQRCGAVMVVGPDELAGGV